MSKLLTPVAVALFLVFLMAGTAVAQSTVYTDETSFDAAVPGASPIDFPSPATVLSYRPYGYLDYSCGPSPPGINLPWPPATPLVNVQTPNAANRDYPNCLIFLLGPSWNAPAGNILPRPTSTTIVANGEDDVQLTFTPPVYAVGLKLLTNNQANETITITYTDSSTQTILDSELQTAANSWEFVGFKSTKPISIILIDNSGGGSQNEGLYGIKVANLAVDIDIKPCSYPNAVNTGSSGVVPVAILGSDVFDVFTVDPNSVMLQGLVVKAVGKTNKLLCHVQDVVGPGQSCGADSYPDLVCQMQMGDLLTPGDSTWRLDANATIDGTVVPLAGYDSVKIVPMNP